MNHNIQGTTPVPCNGCTLCCKGDAVRLLPGDDARIYETEPHPFGGLMLAHKKNRECLYLGEDGCDIHEFRPRMCREMDCRNLAKITFTKARKLDKRGRLRLPVWRRGKDLLRQG